MRYALGMKHRLVLASVLLGGLIGLLVIMHRSPTWTSVHAGTYTVGSREGRPQDPAFRTVDVQAFAIMRYPVTVGEFVRYLRQTRPQPPFESTQIERHGHGYRATVRRREPVAFVTFADAEAYAQWASRRQHGTLRLPTADEWEIAARAGSPATRYPWGWAPPEGRAHFNADHPIPVGRYPPNPWGLYDMAGNVAEWCLPDGPAHDWAFALGGSWAERDPTFLRVYQRVQFPRTYRDADVGFRLVRTSR